MSFSSSPASTSKETGSGTGTGTGTGTGSGGGNPLKETRQQVIGGQYFLGETLGKSLFGVVYQGLNSNNGEFVAIKQIPLDEIDPEKVSNIKKEIEVWKNLEHPNIVRVYDAITTDQHLYLVLELVEGGSVVQMKENFGSLPEPLVAKYVSKCLKGLSYLHKAGIVHCDIKGVNILIARDGQVKLADCVQPKLKGSKDAMTIGQPYWMAPEVIKNNAETYKSDVWSLGCTVIELFSGLPPYAHLASMAAVIQIMKNPHPPLPEGISPELKEFLLACLQKDADQRLTVEELLTLPWVTNAQDIPESTESLPLSKKSEENLTPNVQGEGDEEGSEGEPVDEEHLTLKVHLSDISDVKLGANPVLSVNLFVFQDTQAAAMVDVALRKAGLEVDPSLYCLVEIDNVTGEERRFNDYELPKLEAQVLWQFEGEIRFSIKKKGSQVKEGWLKRKGQKRWGRYYCVLDTIERYFGCYEKKPENRDEDLAKHVIFSFHLIKWVYINDELEDSFVIKFINEKEETYQAESHEDMISWINEIRYACDIHFLFDEE